MGFSIIRNCGENITLMKIPYLVLGVCAIVICLPGKAIGQDTPSSTSSYADLTMGIGSVTSVSLGYQYNWKFGKKQKLEMGVGGRFSSFFSSDKYFVTAPAKLSKGSSGPGALFKETIPANMDSVLMPSAQINSLNVMLNVVYNFSEKFRAGFNIDVIGFSFGGSKPGTYINGNGASGAQMVSTSASPSGFNLLLVGENDLGSLNSEFYVAYSVNDTWSIKLGAQHIFMEYTTATKVQQFPEANDRFRITPTIISLGASYKLR